MTKPGGVKSLLKIIADLACQQCVHVACATVFLSTGPALLGGTWSENMTIPKVTLSSWRIEGFAGIAVPSVSQSVTQV